ncbi:UNVERIFIED_CONTAM: penicillin-binding protein [Brevibacillus sp. OAP136]
MPNTNSPASSDTPGKKRRRRSKKATFFLILQLLLLFGFMSVLLAGGVVTGYVAALVKDEPVRSYDEIHTKIFSNDLTGFAYYNDGTLIGQLRTPDEDRRLVKKSEVSPYLINAIIATEDKTFYEHHGVSLQSTLRGAYQEFTNQPVVTGGSTLTQQLIKNTILNADVNHKRKAKEIFSALRIERMFSKDQILEAYMNEIYFGHSANRTNIYGVQAAAKGIFNKDVKDLDLTQASYLAGMIQNPGSYSPFSTEGYKRGKERQKMVLDRMMENGYITKSQYDEASGANLQAILAKPERKAYSEFPYLMMDIEQRAAKALLDAQLASEGKDKDEIGKTEYRRMLDLKSREVLRSGYKIYTTVDKDLNKMMQDFASDPKNFAKNATYTNANGKRIENALEEVGSMLIQNKTGAILGMMGGRDFSVEQTNHTTAPRQPGSAMKPLAAYGPAFELGYLQPGSPIDDSPLALPDGQKGVHLPQNWDFKYHGMISAREALRQSWNVPAIRAYMKVGIPTALDFVKKMGVTTLVEDDDHATTGVIGGLTYGLTVEEITNAYATFANHGSFIDAYMIDRIEDSSGNVIFKHEIKPEPVFSEETAYLMTDMMRTVVDSGTGAGVRKYITRGIDIAGKTGTTNSDNDAWFVAYTPEVTLGVWTGYDEPHRVPNSRRPIEIWGKVMQNVMKTKPDLSGKNEKFQKPRNVITATIDSKSGLLPSELSKEAKHTITDLFNRQFVPTKVDDTHQKARVVTIDETRYLAKDGTPDEFVEEGIFFKPPDTQQLSAAQISALNKKAGTKAADWAERMPTETDPRTEMPGAPVAPGKVTAGKGEKGVHISWQPGNETDLLGYRLYRASADHGFEKLAVIKDPKAGGYDDSTAKASGTYGYYLTSVDITGAESSPSPIASLGTSTVWEYPIPGDTTPNSGTDTNNQPGTNGPGTQPGVDPNQPGTPTEPTDTNTNTNANGLPSTPKSLSIKKTGTGYALKWKANSGSEQVIAYNIYYSLDPANGFQLLDTAVGTTYVHSTPEKNGWYYVSAVNSNGESPQSASVNAAQAE